MAEEGFKRKLAAILSTDVKGYSRLSDFIPCKMEKAGLPKWASLFFYIYKTWNQYVSVFGGKLLTTFNDHFGCERR
jgi:hypothetical protein